MLKEVEVYERERFAVVHRDPFRLNFHLMPPVGWLNDPNGLCQLGGTYHVFFQYSPYEVQGGRKFWGHYTSRDLLCWEYQGAALAPDAAFDRNGVYSGSALPEGGKLCLFYTGNVKLVGEYDFINDGREANVIRTDSADGISFGEKKELLRNSDYPADCTCHVRDPKVFSDGGSFYMVLGARTKEDEGCVLLYESQDLENWEYKKRFVSQEKFGFMWECPDLIAAGKNQFLAVSPQGLARGEFEYQNVYQSGYFRIEGDFKRDCALSGFREWDMGFDFYAPQTFVDERGRHILIGWAGMPDSLDEYRNPTDARGWQHALTVPRQLTEKDGALLQNPVEEIDALRKAAVELEEGQAAVFENGCFDLLLTCEAAQEVEIEIQEGLKFIWKDGVAQLILSEEAGAGRLSRKAKLSSLREVRILADTSLIEIYLNGGEMVFTTRFYAEPLRRTVRVKKGGRAVAYEMGAMQVRYH